MLKRIFARGSSRLLAGLARPLYLLVLTVGGGAILIAQTVPNTFQSGNVVSSSQLNENFTALQTALTQMEASLVPVGSVRAALLNESAFASAGGDPSTFNASTSKWALADGRNVAGSRFATLSGGTTVPDLRGLFLRGLNVGRADGLQDTAGGGRVAGDYQGDAFASHNHTNGAYAFLSRTNPGFGTTGALTDGTGVGEPDIQSVAPLLAAGSGSETRSRNAAVYYYVRIN